MRSIAGDASVSPVAETIWLSPYVAANDHQPLCGDDGVGGYAPLAAVTGSGGSAAIYWVHGNHIGVPLVTADASGAVATPSGYTTLGFPGQTRTLADLYYNRYRDYDSSLGRYIQADPIGLGGGNNPYLYAGGNPLRFIDPSGKMAGAAGAAAEFAVDLCFTNWISAVACSGAAFAIWKLSQLCWATLFPDLAIANAPPFQNSEPDDAGNGPSKRPPPTASPPGGTRAASPPAPMGPGGPDDPDDWGNDDPTWGRPDTLADHYARHGSDFGAKSEADYAKQASEFLQRSQRDGLPTKIDSKGVIRTYDPKTNTFGAYNADGTTRTFFKPDPAFHKFPTNMDFWNAQPGAPPVIFGGN